MTEESLLQAVQELVAIQSTQDNPGGLREAYTFMLERVLAANKDITIEEFESDGKPSFLAYRGQQRPDNFRIILNGHVDVVPGKPEQFKAVVKDGKMYGRGVYDMKGAAIVLTEVFCEFVDKVPYALALQITTDEEPNGINGTKYQIAQGVRGDFVICGECGRSTSVYEVANEAKGSVAFTLGFRGNSAHGGYPWRGDNAALKAAEFARKLHERYPTPPEATSETTITLTSIVTHDVAHNRIPDFVTAIIDARYAPGDPQFRSRAHVAALIEEIDPNAEIIGFDHFDAPIYTSPNNPLLQALKTSAERVEGAEFSFVRRNGTSDGRFYGAVGDQACEFGIAGENPHSDDEYITLRAFSNYLATMRDFLEKTVTSEQGNTRTRAYNG